MSSSELESYTDYKERFKTLAEDLKAYEIENDALKQNICLLKRELSSEKSSNKYLVDELENIEHKNAVDLASYQKNAIEKIELLKEENCCLKESVTELETRIKHVLLEKQKSIQANFQFNNNELQQNTTLDDGKLVYQVELNYVKDQLRKIETEAHELLEKLIVSYSENKEMKQKIEWLETKLETKKIELDEKSEQADNLQEKNIELSLELNSLKENTQNHGQKGNSLFAEVDDQRQKFRQLLADQNSQYQQVNEEIIFCNVSTLLLFFYIFKDDKSLSGWSSGNTSAKKRESRDR